MNRTRLASTGVRSGGAWPRRNPCGILRDSRHGRWLRRGDGDIPPDYSRSVDGGCRSPSARLLFHRESPDVESRGTLREGHPIRRRDPE